MKVCENIQFVLSASKSMVLEMANDFIFFLIKYWIKSSEISYLGVIFFYIKYQIIIIKKFSFLRALYLKSII